MLEEFRRHLIPLALDNLNGARPEPNRTRNLKQAPKNELPIDRVLVSHALANLNRAADEHAAACAASP